MAQFENEGRNNFFLNFQVDNYEIHTTYSPHVLSNHDNDPPLSQLPTEGTTDCTSEAMKMKLLISNATKILFLLNDITEILFQHISNTSSSLFLLSSLYLFNKRTNSSLLITEIYLFKNQILIIRNMNHSFLSNKFPVELTYQWLNHVLYSNIQQFYIIDALYSSQYNSSHTLHSSSSSSSSSTPSARHLRMIFNNFVSSTIQNQYLKISSLEIGNIIESLTAAIICYCELHSLPCITCLVIRETLYTIETANSLLAILPQLNEYLDHSTADTTNHEEEEYHRSFNKIHQQMIKNDQFRSRTCNMFI